MSFSIAISDFIAVDTLAWKVYKACKEAPECFQNIHTEVLSLQAVLKEVEETVLVRPLPPEREARLTNVASGCNSVLIDLQDLVARYEGLGAQSKRTWDRMKWGTEDIAEIRARLVSNTNLLTALLSTSQLSVEHKLDKFIAEFRAGKREGSIISIATQDSLEPDEREKWRTIRKELESVGVSVDAFDANREFILQWFRNAVESGLFEETQDDPLGSLHSPKSETPLSIHGNGLLTHPEPTSSVVSTSRSSYNSDSYCGSSQSKTGEKATNLARKRNKSSIPSSNSSYRHRCARLDSGIERIKRNTDLLEAVATQKLVKVFQILIDNAQSRILRPGIMDTALLKAIGCGWHGAILPLVAASSSSGIIFALPSVGELKYLGPDFYRKYFALRPHIRGIQPDEFEGSIRAAVALPIINRVLSTRDSEGVANPAQAVLYSTIADGSIDQALLRLLITYDANINAADPSGAPLYSAIGYGREDLVRLLLEYGADVNHEYTGSGNHQSTPLIHAVVLEQETIVRLLVSKEADVNHVVFRGPAEILKDAIHAAIFAQNEALLQFLFDHGAVTDWKSALAMAYSIRESSGLRWKCNGIIRILVKKVSYDALHLEEEDFPPDSNIYTYGAGFVNKELDYLFAP